MDPRSKLYNVKISLKETLDIFNKHYTKHLRKILDPFQTKVEISHKLYENSDDEGNLKLGKIIEIVDSTRTNKMYGGANKFQNAFKEEIRSIGKEKIKEENKLKIEITNFIIEELHKEINKQIIDKICFSSKYPEETTITKEDLGKFVKDDVLGIIYWTNKDGSIKFRVRGIGPTYNEFFNYIEDKPVKFTNDDWPWSFFVLTNPNFLPILQEKYRNNIWQDIS